MTDLKQTKQPPVSKLNKATDTFGELLLYYALLVIPKIDANWAKLAASCARNCSRLLNLGGLGRVL